MNQYVFEEERPVVDTKARVPDICNLSDALQGNIPTYFPG